VTLLFSDIRGFTTLSESRSPHEVVEILNRYFTRQVDVIFRHGGSLDKFIGDAIMAFWGAPLDDPEHARNAVSCALDMADTLLAFKAELGELGANFDVGIGVHSGPAVVGLIGSDKRREYTSIGDTVNLASRIEGLTKEAGHRILVSRETMERCHGAFDFVSCGTFQAKGRAQPVELFEPRRNRENSRLAPGQPVPRRACVCRRAAAVIRATGEANSASDAASSGQLAENAKVDALERKGGWTRVKAAGGAEGWVRMLALRYDAAGAARQGDSGIAQALNVARTGTSGTQVTTGVRGLDAEQLANARPNTAELKKLERYSASKDAAAAFAERGPLRAQQVSYP
jgi:class 3 adenylate cyclase